MKRKLLVFLIGILSLVGILNLNFSFAEEEIDIASLIPVEAELNCSLVQQQINNYPSYKYKIDRFYQVLANKNKTIKDKYYDKIGKIVDKYLQKIDKYKQKKAYIVLGYLKCKNEAEKQQNKDVCSLFSYKEKFDYSNPNQTYIKGYTVYFGNKKISDITDPYYGIYNKISKTYCKNGRFYIEESGGDGPEVWYKLKIFNKDGLVLSEKCTNAFVDGKEIYTYYGNGEVKESIYTYQHPGLRGYMDFSRCKKLANKEQSGLVYTLGDFLKGSKVDIFVQPGYEVYSVNSCNYNMDVSSQSHCIRNETLDYNYRTFYNAIKKGRMVEAASFANSNPEILKMGMRGIVAKAVYCGNKPRLYVLEIGNGDGLLVTEIKYDKNKDEFSFIRHNLDLNKLYNVKVEDMDSLQFQKLVDRVVNDFKNFPEKYAVCNF